jgi:2-polyprenyl-3-methyl-5-hydroxy-6-metoxy-1,4-benzoquinol methylase
MKGSRNEARATESDRHRYDYDVELDVQSAAAAVVRMVGQNKRVLDLGAGPGSITRLLTNESGCTVTAVEIDQTAVDSLARYCESVQQLDLDGSDWVEGVLPGGPFEVVVLADVLEHLRHPEEVLAGVTQVLDGGGYLVLSLPHIAHNAVIACLVEEDFAYGESGLLDRTHVRFFGIHNMQRLLNEAGFSIDDAEFIVFGPEQTELATNWWRAPRRLKSCLSRNRFGLVYQVVIKASPGSQSGPGLVLSSLPVPTPGPRAHSLSGRAIEGVKRIARRHLSPENRRRVRRVAERARNRCH